MVRGVEVTATRVIAAPPARIFAFLERFDRHWELLGSRLEPLRAYDGSRSQARLHGPLGIHRTLWIELAELDPPRELTGRVEAGRGRTVGTVRWVVVPADGAAPPVGTVSADPGVPGGDAPAAATVELTARTDVAGPLDRLLLLAGGRHWLRQSLELVLARLDARVASTGAGAGDARAADAATGTGASAEVPPGPDAEVRTAPPQRG